MKRKKLLTLAVTATLVLSATCLLFAQETAVHLTLAEATKAAKERPAPDCPAMAKQLHLEGEVQVQAHISESGSVEEVKPLTGNAVLANAAVKAMRRWKFAPVVTDGKARKAVTEMRFSVKL